MQLSWRGVYPAVTTQFHDDQTLDLAGTGKHLDVLVGAGVHGVIMLGTVGENCSLEYREKLDVLRAAEIVEGARLKVYKGGAHGICTTQKDDVNEDLLAFIKGK